MVFNAPHRESTLKKKGRWRQCCLPRCKSMGLLSHTEFTLHSFQCNDRPTLVLEIFLIFRVKSRMFLFSKAEVGLRHPFLLSYLLDGNQPEKRELTALPAICAIMGQPCRTSIKSVQQSLTTYLLLAILGSVSCPSDARLEPLSWPTSCGNTLVFVGFHLKFSDKNGGGCSQVWAARC